MISDSAEYVIRQRYQLLRYIGVAMDVLLQGVSKSFGDNIVVNNVSHLFRSGEISVITGESGSGKSTLLNIMALFTDPDRGVVEYNDVQVTKLSANEKLNFIRKNIGYIYQDIRIFEDLSAFDNLRVGLMFSDIPKKEYSHKISEMLLLLKLEGKTNEKAGVLSGGEKQRLAIGRAFIANKKIILADEPTGALDKENTVNILKLIKKINTHFRTTIVMITHSSVVSSYFENRVKLVDGKLYEE